VYIDQTINCRNQTFKRYVAKTKGLKTEGAKDQGANDWWSKTPGPILIKLYKQQASKIYIITVNILSGF